MEDEDKEDRVKITILDKLPEEEDEIIVKCDKIDEHLLKFLNRFKMGNAKLRGYKDGAIHLLEPRDVYYFESVDQRVFAYTKTQVYEIKNRLYELEEELPTEDFLRATKSTILNINKIKSLAPSLGGRFEVLLLNGEKTVISRQYVGVLKEKLGLS